MSAGVGKREGGGDRMHGQVCFPDYIKYSVFILINENFVLVI